MLYPVKAPLSIAELTIWECERIWLAVSDSSSDDSSESWRAVCPRLLLLLNNSFSCRVCISPLSRLSMERRRAPQLKLSTVSPCGGHSLKPLQLCTAPHALRHSRTHACMHALIHSHTCTHTHARKHTHIRTHAHIHTHTHTHTHTIPDTKPKPMLRTCVSLYRMEGND